VKKLFFAVTAISFSLPALFAFADTLELKNGSRIQGTFIGASAAQISFRVGPRLQHYAVAEVAAVKFDPDLIGSAHYRSYAPSAKRSSAPPPSHSVPAPLPVNNSPAPQPANNAPAPPPQVGSAPVRAGNEISLPAGTRLIIRMVDDVDSDHNRVGDRFAAMLDQPLYVNQTLVAPRGTSVYGRLEEEKQTRQLTGKAQLRLSLNGIVVNGQHYVLSTGDYELSGKSRSSNTVTKAGGGVAAGAPVGAVAGDGKVVAPGAGVGNGAGIATPLATKGDQIHVPSETLLEFSLDQPVTLPIAQAN
jgi:hypothetical protein